MARSTVHRPNISLISLEGATLAAKASHEIDQLRTPGKSPSLGPCNTSEIMDSCGARAPQPVVIPPADARIVEFKDLLKSKPRQAPLQSWFDAFDRAGIQPGKTAYIRLPSGSVCEIRRKQFKNPTEPVEIVWVRGEHAITAFRNATFLGGQVVVNATPNREVLGFYDGCNDAVFAPMIAKRPQGPSREWRTDCLRTLSTFIHEREHSYGRGEYYARLAQDRYLIRASAQPMYGSVYARLDAILNNYSLKQYRLAVGEAVHEAGAPLSVLVKAMPDDCIFRDTAIGSRWSGDLATSIYAQLTSFGLLKDTSDPVSSRIVYLAQDGRFSSKAHALSAPLCDRIMEFAGRPEFYHLRRFLSDAIGKVIVDETLLRIDQQAAPLDTSRGVVMTAGEVIQDIKFGDVHRAVNQDLMIEGSLAIPMKQGELRLSAGLHGPILTTNNGLTIFYASGIHEGAALSIPIMDRETWKAIPDILDHFYKNRALFRKLQLRRSVAQCWDGCLVDEVCPGARYLFGASDTHYAPAPAPVPVETSRALTAPEWRRGWTDLLKVLRKGPRKKVTG